MSKNRKINPLGLYHIFNRGNNKENIFPEAEDKYMFLSIVKRYCSIYGILVYAYCVMNNHYHLFIDDLYDNVSDCMRDIQARYAEYYNSKYNRSGHVFQGRFGSCVVRGYKYCTRLIRYILRNPVKAKLTDDPRSYKWSSLGSSNISLALVDVSYVETIFQNANYDFDTYINDDSDNHLISALEKQLYSFDDAKEIYNETLKQKYKINTEDFSIQSVNIKLKILMELRYIGLSIRQLSRLSGASEYFIRRASPRDLEYL